MDEQTSPQRFVLLAVDDDAQTLQTLRQAFCAPAFELHQLSDPSRLHRYRERPPGHTDLIILEPALGDGLGLQACRALRAAGDDTPIIMLSHDAGQEQRIGGLEAGADDFLVKPCSPRELKAKVMAMLRRRALPDSPGAPSQTAEIVQFGPYEFDLQHRLLRKQGQAVPLTTGEFAMLKALARHPGQPLSRERLARLARGRAFGPSDRSLDVQVSRLRRMLEADPAHPRYIQTVWGVGYVFVPDRPELRT